MGYPMTWDRVINRNSLVGNYTKARCCGGGVVAGYQEEVAQHLRMISGDIRRLEQDSVDGDYATKRIAEKAGVDIETVQKVLKSFFEGAPNLPPHDDYTPVDPKA